jgi:hypothetical protein
MGDLPCDLASDYEARLREAGMAQELDELLVVYRRLREESRLDHDSLAAALFADAKLKRVAHQLIVLWYSSALIENIDETAPPRLKFGKPQHHFRSLLWEVIGAHPPALSGGYFGYWRYPPENRLP